MIVDGLSWQQKLDSLAERIGEPDMALGPGQNAEANVPYFDFSTAEQWLYFSSLFYLRRCPSVDLQRIGSVALQTLTGAVPLNTVRVISAQINPDGTGYLPADYVDPARYLQLLSLSATTGLYWTFLNGTLQYKGTAIKATALVEPTLAAFQADTPVVPSVYDEDIIDRARKLLMVQTFLPMGRL